MSAAHISRLRAEVARLEARVDSIRAVPGGRKACGYYGAIVGRLVLARERLMVAQDPAMSAFLGR